MSTKKRTRPWVQILAFGAVLVACALPAFALRVAWNTDIHQNKFNDGIGANDFHVWGVLESGDPSGANPPSFVSQVNFRTLGPPGFQPMIGGNPAFNNFAWRIDNGVGPPPGLPLNWPIIPPPPPPVPPAMPLLPPPPGPPYMPPFYYFQADWTNPQANIPFCNWVHFGLEFDETCHNIGYWLQGAWTQDGVDPGGVPILGFDVQDQSPNPYMRIQHAAGGEEGELAVEIKQMQMLILPHEEGMAFTLENLNKSFFDMHPEYQWVNVPTNLLPQGPWIDSFFDVFFDQVPGLGDLGDTGAVLIARQEMGTLQDPSFWQYELHESHTPEPLTILAMLAGIGGLGGYLRRRRA